MNKVAKKVCGIAMSAAMAMSLVVVAAPATAQAATDVTVYFDNSANWDSVYVYYTLSDADSWSDAAWSNALSDSDGDGWYEFSVSVDDYSNFVFIFVNNNDWSSWGADAQTANLVVPDGATEAWITFADYYQGAVDDGTAVSTTAPDGWGSADSSDDSSNDSSDDSSASTDDTDDSSSTVTEGATTTVYFSNPDGWSTVYVYIMDSSWATIEGYEDYATWPGAEVSVDSDGQYAITIPDDTDVYLIFNDGASEGAAQTADLLHTAGDGSVTYDLEGVTSTNSSSDSSSNSDSGSDNSTQSGDVTPIAAAAVALIGCAAIVVALKKKAA